MRLIVTRTNRNKDPVLWVIDSEQWPRACLRAELIERGYNPYGFISPAAALERLARDASAKPEAIILELRGQSLMADSIEAIQNLQIPTIVLGGAVELNNPLIQKRAWTVVLKRPVSLGEIADAAEQIVAQPPT